MGTRFLRTDLPAEADDLALVAGAAPPAATSTSMWLRERIDVRLAVVVGVAWLVIPQVMAVLEPTAREESEPLIGTVLATAMGLILLTMLVGLGFRRRWGLLASLSAAVLAAALAVACPVSGHHSFGLWWYGELACVSALSVGALRRAAPQQQ